jgi:hypothetical protein
MLANRPGRGPSPDSRFGTIGWNADQDKGIGRVVVTLQGRDGSTEIMRYDCPLANPACVSRESGELDRGNNA